MEARNIVLICLITFVWIWSLPLLIIGSLFMMPAALGISFVCIFLGMFLQYSEHSMVQPEHWIRTYMSKISWNQWFPCNILHFDKGVIAVHPHGVLCCGALAGIHFAPDSKTCMCIAPVVFYVPIIGLFARKLGCIPADRHHMTLALNKGYPVLVVPGGVPEIVMAESGNDQKRFERHGFLRIAQEMNAEVHAVYAQGECNTYKMFKGPFFETRIWISWWLNIPLVFPILLGWYGSWMPKRVPLLLKTLKIESYDKQIYKKKLETLYKNTKLMSI